MSPLDRIRQLTDENAILRTQLRDAHEQAKRDTETIAKLSKERTRYRQRDDVLTSAMAEVRATDEGLSRQPISAIVRGCISELMRIN